ncbi:uncharacterized protein [Ambystoma mexicanum]|uniref:uncharacterized protein n=1 Tax=Ambystoma mexicanum TaxID=8296 RepID=UPI0037E8ED93
MEADHIHMFWSCDVLSPYWKAIIEALSEITGIHISPDPLTALFGLWDGPENIEVPVLEHSTEKDVMEQGFSDIHTSIILSASLERSPTELAEPTKNIDVPAVEYVTEEKHMMEERHSDIHISTLSYPSLASNDRSPEEEAEPTKNINLPAVEYVTEEKHMMEERHSDIHISTLSYPSLASNERSPEEEAEPTKIIEVPVPEHTTEKDVMEQGFSDIHTSIISSASLERSPTELAEPTQVAIEITST